MLTVLLAEKEYIDAIRQTNKLFFEPFLDSKDLAFCYWNPSGQNLREAVPELLDIVGRRKDWRVVILNNCTAESMKTRNPFDTVDYSTLASLVAPNSKPASEESWDDWEAGWKSYYEVLEQEKEAVYKRAMEQPLQQLATWLCFRPEDFILNEVQDTQNAHEWAIDQLRKDQAKPSDRLEVLEKAQYKKELRMKEMIRRDFVGEDYLNIAYPAEIHCITVRTTEKSFFDPDTYWNIRSESEYSAFADRNMYFDKMRFVVFDLLARTHRNFRTDYIRFLASVLIYASNPVPTSAMQARRLYRLETETDERPLCTLVTSYDRKLAATAEVIENEMERIRSEIPSALTDKDAEAFFCTPREISVLLDESCDPEKVITEKDYGLFFDSPENELHKWNRAYDVSGKALAYITKQRARSVKKSVAQAHYASEINGVDISRLTPFQIDDIRSYTENAEDEMMDSVPPSFLDSSNYTKRLAEESENVKKVLRRRMKKKTTLILSGICLGLMLICFCPFLLDNGGTTKTFSTAILFTGIMLGVLGAIILVILFFLRSSVLHAVGDYNNEARGVLAEINTSMGLFSKYLGRMSDVRRGYAVQKHAEKNIDEYTQSLHIRKKHLEDIRKKRAYLAEDYQDYLGDSTFCDEAMSRPYDYDFDYRTEYEYPAPFLAADSRRIEFASKGNYVEVPSSYITSIMVRMEGIYEK